jgi:hypothetical protein
MSQTFPLRFNELQWPAAIPCDTTATRKATRKRVGEGIASGAEDPLREAKV